MNKTKPEKTKERIPCESEGIYTSINKVKRSLKGKKSEKNAVVRKIKPNLKIGKKNGRKYEAERIKMVYLSYTNDAINDCYYSITGYRYYVEKLCDYVERLMATEDEIKEVFISVFNSNITYMDFLCKKLDEKLDEYAAKTEKDYRFENRLYVLMKMFVALAYDLKLDKYERFSPEEYRIAVEVYCKKVKADLLDVYLKGE